MGHIGSVDFTPRLIAIMARNASLMLVFIAATVLSTEACGPGLQKCISDLRVGASKAGAGCNALDDYTSCVDRNLGSCPVAMKDVMKKQYNAQMSQMKSLYGLGDCT